MTDIIHYDPQEEPEGSAGKRAYEGFKKSLGPAKLASRIPGVGRVIALGVLANGAVSGVLSSKKAASCDNVVSGCPNCGGSWQVSRGLSRDNSACGVCDYSCDGPGTGRRLIQMATNFTKDFAAAAHADATKNGQRRR